MISQIFCGAASSCVLLVAPFFEARIRDLTKPKRKATFFAACFVVKRVITFSVCASNVYAVFSSGFSGGFQAFCGLGLQLMHLSRRFSIWEFNFCTAPNLKLPNLAVFRLILVTWRRVFRIFCKMLWSAGENRLLLPGLTEYQNRIHAYLF